MKKAKSTSDEPRREYQRSDFKKLERGRYTSRIQARSNVVVPEPEVAASFPNSAAVNKALRSLAEVAETVSAPAPDARPPSRPRLSARSACDAVTARVN